MSSLGPSLSAAGCLPLLSWVEPGGVACLLWHSDQVPLDWLETGREGGGGGGGE